MFLNNIFRGSLIRNYYYNNICKHIVRKEKGRLTANYDSVFIFEKSAKLILYGVLFTNFNCKKRNKRSTIIRLDKEAAMDVRGKFQIYYGGDICCFQGSRLELGSGFLNSNCKIRCKKYIKIGENVAISHDVTIMDSDGHKLNYSGYSETKPVIIDNNVWIGSRSIILKGVHIGEHSVIGAGSVVTNDVPPFCIAAGNPAKVIRKNIEWNI